MLMRWGMERCDGLGVPAYLEASAGGEGLYRRCGFVEVEVEEEEGEEGEEEGGGRKNRRRKEVRYPTMLRLPVGKG